MKLNNISKDRIDLSEKWGGLGLLDGLKGHVRDDISQLFECQSEYRMTEEDFSKFENKHNMENEEKTILAVDMDGVIADFNRELNILAPELELHEGEGYEERSKIVDKVCQDNPGVFLRLEAITGGIEAVKKLAEKYEIHFLSTPMCDLYESYAHKPEWLRKHFGEWAKKRLTLTHNKQLFGAKILIDDRLKNGVKEFKGEHIHFGTEKFPDWNSVLNYLL